LGFPTGWSFTTHQEPKWEECDGSSKFLDAYLKFIDVCYAFYEYIVFIYAWYAYGALMFAMLAMYILCSFMLGMLVVHSIFALFDDCSWLMLS
jgi:hypothetical protein